jgi:hypothetical protein
VPAEIPAPDFVTFVAFCVELFCHTNLKEEVMIGGVKHVVVNEGQEETFLNLFRTLKSEMIKNEAGNVYYDLYRSRKARLLCFRNRVIGWTWRSTWRKIRRPPPIRVER